MNNITENTYQVGMPYAIDHNGKKVDARDAEEHTPYECPFCHCLMFHRRSHKGVHSFVRYQGQVHMADPVSQELCRLRIETERLEHKVQELTEKEKI